MPPAAAKLLTEALALPAAERLDLAAELMAGVDGEADPGWEAAWIAECDRRMVEHESGAAAAVPWAEARARILARLAGR